MTSRPLFCSQAALLSGCPCKSTIWNLASSIHPAVNYASSSCVLYIYINILAESATCGVKQNSPLCMDTNRSGKKLGIRIYKRRTLKSWNLDISTAKAPSIWLSWGPHDTCCFSAVINSETLEAESAVVSSMNGGTYAQDLQILPILNGEHRGNPNVRQPFWVMCSAERLRRPTPCR